MTASQSIANPSAAMAAGLARLWQKFQPEMQERLTILESAALALHAGTLTPQARDEAHAAAHKLAGSLGTFGLQRGTGLARQSELLLADEVQTEKAELLFGWIEELRALIAQRSQ